MTNFLDMLSQEDREQIRSHMYRRRYGRNEVVFHQGDPGASLHVIVNGWFLVQTLTGTGGRVGMTIEGPGEVFGELALLNAERRRTAEIRALVPAETLVMEAGDFYQLRDTRSEIDRFLVLLLTARVERLTHQLTDAAWTPADKRVCRLVVRLHEAFGGGTIQLRQIELASLAHTTRPTVSTVLAELARDGLVTTGRGSVTVIDLPGLEARANFPPGQPGLPLNGRSPF